jgi:cob(I)alamin adenosyltransferase
MTEQSTKLYTRTGDSGTTGLLGSNRALKDSLRIQAIGELDEVNSQLGVVRAFCSDEQMGGFLLEIQKLLLELGTELAQPAGSRLVHAHTARLEQFINRFNEALPGLRSFILPGGTPAAAHCHLARTVCRRAERSLFRLSRTEHVNAASLQFVNRLSDLLFVVARTLNYRAGVADLAWHPQDKERASPVKA